MPTKEEDKGSSVRKPTTSEKEFQKNPNELDKNWTRSQQKKTTKDHEWETDLWQRGNFGRMWIWNVSEILTLHSGNLYAGEGCRNMSQSMVFWCLVGPEVVYFMSGRSFLWPHLHSASQKPQIFKFLDFLDLGQICLEGPLINFVDWKVVCNASFGCLGVPGVDFGWYEAPSLSPFCHRRPKPNFYFSLR